MKRVLIAAATAAVLAASTLSGVGAANASEVAPGVVQVNGPGQWNGGNGNWNGNGGRNGNWNQGGNWNNGHGNWNNGSGRWNGGNWQGPPRWKARKSCDPIVRWRLVGPPWNKRWDRVIVGYDCDWKRPHW